MLCVVVVLFLGTELYAADGDLMVNGMVSIGTTTPTAKFNIVSSSTSTPILNIQNGLRKNVMTIAPNGNIGIGTSTPSAQFSIRGTAGTSSPTQLSGTVQADFGNDVFGTNTKFKTELALGDVILISNTYCIVTSILSDTYLTAYYQGDSVSGVSLYRQPSPAFAIYDTYNNNLLTVLPIGGNVGIGTIVPNTKLQVNGGISLGSGTAQTNKLLCWTSTGAIGYCSETSVTNASCTCTAIQ